MRRTPSLASERGAVLIQTAIAALVLVGFGTFVVDYGVLWVARHQAQNAADAGAMAGALARAYEDFDDPPDPGGVAAQYAQQVAGANLVWGASAPTTAAVPSFDGVCPPEVGAPDRCVRMDVYRNGEQGSAALQAWFGHAFGIVSQGVKATARAQVLIPNATNCLRPWAIPDKWTESDAATLPFDFKKYQDGSGAPLAPPHDDYQPPSSTGIGTGLTFATSNLALGDLGLTLLPITYDDLTNPANKIFQGSLVPLDLAGGYAASLAACNGQIVSVGDQISLSPTAPQPSDFTTMLDADPAASWNAGLRTIVDSCAPACAPLSPRLVAVAVFDVDTFQFRRATTDWSGCPPLTPACVPCPGGIPCVSVVNIVGLFIADGLPVGHLTSYPGMIPTEAPKLTAASSFLKAITLVR
jgi:hypothetical protein